MSADALAAKALGLLEQAEKARVLQNVDEELAEDMAGFYLDPYGFVLYAFNWGVGDLAGFEGPDEWQTEFLKSIRDRLQELRSNDETANDALFQAVRAGHGVGKSAVTSWLILWLMSTRPHFVGVVTANTREQLTRKTWRELAIWHTRCITAHWFVYNATSFHHVVHRSTWRFDATPWSEHNSEAFAGMHNGGRGQAMIFDEASGIADKIWEVAEGAMSDPDAFWFAFGNPTRRSGRFFDIWNRFAKRWKKFTVDARRAKAANKKRLEEIIEDWGIDSDYVRVRVLGEFPQQDVATLIPWNLLESAMRRPASGCERYRPVWGLDVARFGDDRTALAIRRNRELLEPVIFWQNLDTMQISERILLKWQSCDEDLRPSAICVDAIGIGAGVVDRLSQLAAEGHFGDTVIRGINVSESASVTEKFSRLRDDLWWRARTWFESMTVSMTKDIEKRGEWLNYQVNEEPLDLTTRRNPICDELKDILFSFLPNGKIKLEPKADTKERLGRSPDGADAFVLTFAEPDLLIVNSFGGEARYKRKSTQNWSAWAS